MNLFLEKKHKGKNLEINGNSYLQEIAMNRV